MFGVNHTKLKTNLKVAIQRLKLLEKKKTEITRKSSKEIADLIQLNKYDRARIRVEHIIREDYLVEGMEIVEMYCDLLLARFGLFETTKEIDPGLYECIASILWVTPRLESEVSELKVISEELQHKYGKDFVMMCKTNKCEKVNERLMLKMSEQGPGDLLVEKYLVEITKSHNVSFKPDPSISIRDPDFFYNSMESPSNSKNNNNNSNNSNNGGGGGHGGSANGPAVIEPTAPPVKQLYPSSQQISYIGFNQRPNSAANSKPAATNGKASENKNDMDDDIVLPGVPTDSYDDLSARFDKLRQK